MMVVVVCNPILDSNATEVKVGLVELRLELSWGCDNSVGWLFLSVRTYIEKLQYKEKLQDKQAQSADRWVRVDFSSSEFSHY